MIAGILFAFFSVMMGAFGAHGLEGRVSPKDLQIWQTASQYQFYHALALILYSLWQNQTKTTSQLVPVFFTIGILIFSGSLYLLVLTQIKKFGMITPIGGLSFMAGWMVWFVYLFKK